MDEPKTKNNNKNEDENGVSAALASSTSCEAAPSAAQEGDKLAQNETRTRTEVAGAA